MIDYSIKWIRVRIEYELKARHNFDFTDATSRDSWRVNYSRRFKPVFAIIVIGCDFSPRGKNHVRPGTIY